MSRAVFQPVTQVRLTNVAVVRVNRTGLRFEIACYRNKVVNWRNRVETDLNEVLQTMTIFKNVSKGVLANKKDLMKAFGTDNENEIIRHILDKGEVQVSDKERRAQYESLFRDVATIISEKCVNPENNRPYTSSIIESAMREIHFSINPNKAAKAQALELIPKLKGVMPISRACMKLKIVIDIESSAQVRTAIQKLGNVNFESQNFDNDECSIIILVDPGLFREIEETVRECTSVGRGHVDVLELSMPHEANVDIDVESIQKNMVNLNINQGEEKDSKSYNHVEFADKNTPIGDGEGENPPELELKDEITKTEKKSKKAKRREKEAAMERKLRDENTAKRLEERLISKIAEGHEIETSEREPAEDTVSSSKLKCNTCMAAFQSTLSYREHFKSDWHRYNLKLKMKGLSTISEDEFRNVDAEGFFFEDR